MSSCRRCHRKCDSAISPIGQVVFHRTVFQVGPSRTIGCVVSCRVCGAVCVPIGFEAPIGVGFFNRGDSPPPIGSAFPPAMALAAAPIGIGTHVAVTRPARYGQGGVQGLGNV